MPAYPFGGHPTLEEYLCWARECGCKTNSGVIVDPDEGPYSVTHIINSDDDRYAIEVGTQANERLAPTTVARLDRRLGMKSPWNPGEGF